MKRLIFVLVILSMIILSGCGGNNITGGTVVCNSPYILVGADCCLDKNSNMICDKDEIEETAEPVEPPKQEVVEEPQVIEEPETVEEPKIEEPAAKPGEYTVKEGEIITFQGKTITISFIGFFQNKLTVTADVDGTQREIFNTKTPEIINGLKIQTLKYEQLKNSVIIKIEKFELGVDEYLVNTRAQLDLFGKKITIRDILSDGAILFDVVQGDEVDFKISLDEGDSKEVQGLTITHIKGFPRSSSGIKLEKYAIIKIQQ